MSEHGSARVQSQPNQAGRPARFGPAQLGGLVVAVVAGLAVYLVGLPGSVSLFGAPLSDLTVPVAIIVAGVVVAVVFGAGAAGSWRVVDIVVASVLGVLGGAVFAIWNVVYSPVLGWMTPPASALYAGMWLLPAVLGGLVVRRPGAAVYTEVVAAVVSMLVGNQWGFVTAYYGLAEGLGAEIVFALLLYRRFGLSAAALAGAGAGVACGLMDSAAYALTGGVLVGYVAFAALSGAVIAGVGSWALARGLARTGALAPLASGRAAARV